MTRYAFHTIAAASAAVLAIGWGAVHAADWFPYKAEAVTPPFAADGKAAPVEYVGVLAKPLVATPSRR